MKSQIAGATAITSLIALILLCLAWELWLAPVRPGGSWLVLKTLPLLTPLFGVLRGRRYTHKWSAMMMLLYFIEGVVRAYSDTGLSARLALVETALATIYFTASITYVRATRTMP